MGWTTRVQFLAGALCPDQLWCPTSFLSSGHWGLFFHRDKADNSHLVPKLRMCGAIPPLPNVFMA